jgi:23S rRNA (pseudouridine1915-N3)-methyltransferase
MKLTVAAVGRLKSGPDRDMVERYRQRVAATGPTVGVSSFEILETPESRARGRDQRMAEEAEALMRLAGATQHGSKPVIVCLDERGRSYGSEAFAQLLGEKAEAGVSRLVFMIGGADGLKRDLVDGADLKLSLSAMTLPHGLARILLAEQVYRAVTILSGHPYHRA